MRLLVVILTLAMSLCLMAGCGKEVVNVEYRDINHFSDADGDGLVRVPASRETGYVTFIANLVDGTLQAINRNDEAIGVRVARDSTSVILSDVWVGEGESAASENLFLEYGVTYDLRVRYYELNVFQFIQNIIDFFGNNEGWERSAPYVRQEYSWLIIFDSK